MIAALLSAALLVGGCDGTPGPVKSTSLFATEDEAFAAAEATYRAYVDAGNGIDLSDPRTFEKALALTTGEANRNERKALTQMAADGWSVSGTTELLWFRGEEWTFSADRVSARACIDVSTVDVRDASGESQVKPDRRDQYAVDLVLLGSESAAHSLKIGAIEAIEDAKCMASDG